MLTCRVCVVIFKRFALSTTIAPWLRHLKISIEVEAHAELSQAQYHQSGPYSRYAYSGGLAEGLRKILPVQASLRPSADIRCKITCVHSSIAGRVPLCYRENTIITRKLYAMEPQLIVMADDEVLVWDVSRWMWRGS